MEVFETIGDCLWCNKNTNLLIELRIAHDDFFDNVNSEDTKGWKAILYEITLQTKNPNFNIDNIRKKWFSLITIYKDFNMFLSLRSNVWPYYDILYTFFNAKEDKNFLKNICRLCKKEFEESTQNQQIKNGTRLCKLIEKYLKIMVSKDTKQFPSSICLGCKTKIEEFHFFKLQCQKIDKRLKLILKGTKSKKRTFEKTEEIILNCEIKYCESDQNVNTLDSEKLEIEQENLKQNEPNFTEDQNHSEEEITKFLCSICGEKFKNSRILKAHEKRHLGIQDFLCNLCPAKFFSSPGLANHMKKEHLKIRYPCKICPKLFKNQSALQRHELVHQGVKNYSCKVENCNLKFFTINEVRSHVRRMHGGQKKIVCNICYKKYFTNSELQIHMRYHTGERPFTCDYPNCEKKYADKFKLKFHIRKKHKNTN